jgi:cell division GTPase FtsZ
MAEIRPDIETFANIKVVGVGGSGGSAVNRMVASKIRGVYLHEYRHTGLAQISR